MGLIHAPLPLILEIMDDHANYVNYFKEDLRESDELTTFDNGAKLVSFRVFDRWPKKKYYTNVIKRNGNLIRWRLAQFDDIEPLKNNERWDDIQAAVKRSLSDFELNTGSWYFIDNFNNTGATLAVKGAVMGSRLATKILNSLSRDNMPQVISDIIAEAATRKPGAGHEKSVATGN